MQPQQPGIATDNLLQHVSVARVLAAGVSLGSGKTFDAVGIPLTYQQDNGEGILIRHTFVANTPTVIAHNLNRIPVGYIVTRANTPCVLYDSLTNAGWTNLQLTLSSNAAADVTFYVF